MIPAASRGPAAGAADPGANPRLAVEYHHTDPATVLTDDDVLAVFGFGQDAPVADDPRFLRVSLQPHGPAPLEVWRTAGPVRRGRAGGIAWADGGGLQFGAIEIGEVGPEGLEGAAEQAYRQLLGFVAGHGHPHLLRIWNYLDAITLGEDDAERYRRFCVGRAAGLGEFDTRGLPAATAIGRRDGDRRLQVYWLAGIRPGTPLENPRQLSAYRYPRRYGPQPPSFARAMLPPDGSDMPLLLSGTAAIVGHESRHVDSLETQLDETLANFEALIGAARVHRPCLPPGFGPGSRLKVYVRDADALGPADALLRQRLGDGVPYLLLHAAVCRRELRIEIDGTHDAPR
ncbi:pteridine-dependent deoxygenase [Lysobacter sp. GX 14042]|uniref:chorismate transformation enzyme, FkbO/Hyg5 family n=1 Tax=Lysobacter sp. GX 14042 TaxID=2907155 RepID=UPI001F1A98B9|nr:pteridine-dependent deoxygenase [Lysobacter sp. GX 14042]MCE7032150.1 pteridine-dependent deoxygenase [Lysobacter sp. GX 14042]